VLRGKWSLRTPMQRETSMKESERTLMAAVKPSTLDQSARILWVELLATE
jgi:hypothetical protein